ncbi:hypothetical protein [uncultured Ferrimonas sp.]|uniref:hypothetical protein n=1 Tax=uncultured Ferrimonas sp. TaxID=432640 RepID=UPI002633853D|nr:hypothetical protein [uncultured Ferrimonas sp.]
MYKIKRQMANVATLTIKLHPLTASLCSDDPISLYDESYNQLNVEQMQLLGHGTPLYVTPVGESSDGFFLLTPEPMLGVLQHHPAAKKLSIPLNVISGEQPDELEAMITTLNLTQPALQHRFQPLQSFSTLSQRVKRGQSLRVPLPTKTRLAQLAGRCNSNFK